MKILSVKLCPHCKEPIKAEADIDNNEVIGFSIAKLGDPLETAHNTQIKQEKGVA